MNTSSIFSGSSSACTLERSTRERVSASRSASALWSGTGAAFGSNPNPERDPPSSSASRSETDSPRGQYHILIVEDNRADAFLIRESIEKAGLDAELHFAQDGERAVRFIEQADGDLSAPCPALIILDINLPRLPGREVLLRIKQSRRCAAAPVIVVTSSNSAKDRTDMAQLGVKDYFCKPSSYAEFLKLGDSVKRFLAEPDPVR